MLVFIDDFGLEWARCNGWEGAVFIIRCLPVLFPSDGCEGGRV